MNYQLFLVIPTGFPVLLWHFLSINLIYYAEINSFSDNKYGKTSNKRRTLAGNKIVDHSDVVGASPVGAAPTTSSFST